MIDSRNVSYENMNDRAKKQRAEKEVEEVEVYWKIPLKDHSRRWMLS